MKEKSKNKNTPLLQILENSTKHLYASFLLLVLLLYGVTLFHEYNLDDELVTRNHALTAQGVKAIPEIFQSPYYKDNMGYAYEYRPIVLVSFAIEHSLFGEKAGVSHFINVLLYLLTAIVLFHLLKLMFPAAHFIFYYLATLFFIAHPLHTEVVANIKNRDEILALLFVLLSWRYALLYVKENSKIIYSFLAIIIFLMAMLSKISVSPFIILIPLSLVLFTATSWKKLLWLIAGFSFPTFFLFPFEHLHIKLGIILGVFAAPVLLKIYFIPLKEIVDFFKLPLQKLNTAADEIKFNLKQEHQQHFYPAHQKIKINAATGWMISLLFVGLSFLVFKFNFHPYIFLLSAIAFFTAYLAIYQSPSVFFLLLAFLVSFTCVVYELSFPSQLLMVFYGIVWYYYKKQKSGVYILISIVGLYAGQMVIDDGDWYTILATFFIGGIFYKRQHPQLKWLFYALLLFFVFSNILFPSRSALFTTVCIFTIAFTSLKYGKHVFLAAIFVLILLHPNFRSHIKPQWITPTEIEIPDKIKSVLPETDRPINFVEMPMKHNAPLPIKIGTAADVMLRYGQLILVPFPMSFYYGYAHIEPSAWSQPLNIFSILFHFILATISFYYLRKHPIISFGIWWYLATIFLFSNLPYPVVGIMGDRFTYTASVGFVILLAYFIYQFIAIKNGIINNTSKKIQYVKILSIAILLGYSLLTVYRNRLWENHLTLMRHDIHHLKNSAQAHNLLALNIMKYEQTDSRYKNAAPQMHQEASFHFKRATEIYPYFFNAWFDLGRTYWHRNLTDSALYAFENAYQADSVYSELLLNLGILHEEKNNIQKSIFYYERLLKLHPDSREGYNNLSYLYFKINQPQASIQTNLNAMRLYPHWGELYENIAQVYISLGDTATANTYLNKKPQ